jgi:hypothetical protein
MNPRNGAIKLNFPHLQPWELRWSCALDVADQAGEKGLPLAELAQAMGISYDRAFQVVDEALDKARKAATEMGDDEVDETLKQRAKRGAK